MYIHISVIALKHRIFTLKNTNFENLTSPNAPHLAAELFSDIFNHVPFSMCSTKSIFLSVLQMDILFQQQFEREKDLVDRECIP